ncbi:hypothetical protein GF359_09845 [candidate division WOR-3 bacterium]|uniref:Uncharacterized protein n=1 Tax=candidate division WOR-3 bacterium TaxID=2052148 RepID=A0A9D5QDX3_UNCW3|nr:hypothetical protein [candidate division WOR-3 bacterium]MBD3365502.1 hypothetical protein [candidate division WOR-3 bacterium]
MKKFFNWLDKTFITPVEESKMSLGTFILIAAGYILIRNMTEGAFESLHILGLAEITLRGVEETFLHLMFSWLYLFLALIVLMRFTTGHDIRKITRVLLTYSFIIIIPVLIDPLVRPGGYRLAYPTDLNTVYQGVSLLIRPWMLIDPEVLMTPGEQLPYGGSPGMLIEAVLGVLLVMTYSGIKAKRKGRKILSVLLSPIVVLGGLTLAGIAQVFMNIIPYDAPVSGLDVYHSGGLITSATRKYAMIILVPFLLILLLGLWLYNKQKVKLLIRSLNPLHLVIGAIAAVSGYFFAWLHLGKVLTGVPANPFDFVAIITLLYLGLTATALSGFLTKGFDPSRPADERKTFKRASWGMFILSFALAWTLGYSTLYIAVVALFVGALLGLPPIRLARFRIPAGLAKAVSAYLLVFCGYALFATEKTFSVVPWQFAVVLFVSLIAIFVAWEFAEKHLKDKKPEASSKGLSETKGA